jgi:hypothetical protein
MSSGQWTEENFVGLNKHDIRFLMKSREYIIELIEDHDEKTGELEEFWQDRIDSISYTLRP